MGMNTGSREPHRIKGKESPMKVAAIQTNPQFGDKKRNIDRQIELISKATKEGARLVVLPELGTTGYMFNNRGELEELAEEIPGGDTCGKWVEICARYGIYLCAGIAERSGSRFYNSAALVGPDGYIGKYRKSHLWDEEKLFFEKGDLGFPVFPLPFGRVGIMICYDGWHPEVARILTLQGADVICDPACWVTVSERTGDEEQIHPLIHKVSANLNGVFMICSDRCGTERDCTFVGNSCIAGPSGYVGGPASRDKEEIVMADINVVGVRYRHWTGLASPLSDRRTDLYDAMLGYNIRPITPPGG